MIKNVYVIGTYSTRFQKWPDKSGKDLTRDALVGVLQDAELDDGGVVESSYFSNCGMGVIWDQDLVRGLGAMDERSRDVKSRMHQEFFWGKSGQGVFSPRESPRKKSRRRGAPAFSLTSRLIAFSDGGL